VYIREIYWYSLYLFKIFCPGFSAGTQPLSFKSFICHIKNHLWLYKYITHVLKFYILQVLVIRNYIWFNIYKSVETTCLELCKPNLFFI